MDLFCSAFWRYAVIQAVSSLLKPFYGSRVFCLRAFCLRTFCLRTFGLYKVFLSLGVTLLLIGCTSQPLLGRWQYQKEATIISLDLQRGEECSLSLSRLTGKGVEKGCRYELEKYPAHDDAGDRIKSYLVFLKDDAGNCDVFADFSFWYEQEANVVTFLVGETPFVMQKRH